MEYSLKKIERDENGLIKGVRYHYTEDGLIDWRKMLKIEHLAANKQKTEETDVSKLEDSEMVILLAGTKYLASLRGYSKVEYIPISTSDKYVCVACKITWTANYETEGRIIEFQSIGDARAETTTGIFSFLLGPIAENRAFTRCVRNFLKINIIAAEELIANKSSDEVPEQASSGPAQMLESLMTKSKFSLEKIKKILLKEGRNECESWNSVNDIPGPIQFELIERINTYIEKKSKGE